QVNKNIKSRDGYAQYSVTFTTGDESTTGSAEIGAWFSKGDGAGYTDDFSINVGGPPPGSDGNSVVARKKTKGGKKGGKQKSENSSEPEE
ncbi:MAG: hypothetical protein WCL19_10775, partial [Verrucomicrobiota bacterium]